MIDSLGHIDSLVNHPAMESSALMIQRLDAAGVSQSAEAKQAEKVAKDFESVLLHRLLEEMKKTVPESELFGGAQSRQINSMFWMFLSQDLADSGGLGLWRDIYSQMMPDAPPADGSATLDTLG